MHLNGWGSYHFRLWNYSSDFIGINPKEILRIICQEDFMSLGKQWDLEVGGWSVSVSNMRCCRKSSILKQFNNILFPKVAAKRKWDRVYKVPSTVLCMQQAVKDIFLLLLFLGNSRLGPAAWVCLRVAGATVVAGSISGVHSRCLGPKWTPPGGLLEYWIGYKTASERGILWEEGSMIYEKEPKEN